MGVLTTSRNVFEKQSYRNVFTKNSPKNPKPIFSRFFLSRIFGRFSVREIQKHHLKKYGGEKELTLVLFWPLTHPPPTHHGGRRLFVGGPLETTWTCCLKFK
jgi:hypothetical protein